MACIFSPLFFFKIRKRYCQIRYNIMGLFMFLNLGIKMPEIRLVIRCIWAPLLHVSVCLHFGNNLSFYHLHFFIVFVFVQKSVKKNGVNVPYKLLSNFIFLFFSFFFFTNSDRWYPQKAILFVTVWEWIK